MLLVCATNNMHNKKAHTTIIIGTLEKKEETKEQRTKESIKMGTHDSK